MDVESFNNEIIELRAELYTLRNERDLVVARLRAILIDLDPEGVRQ